MMQKNWPVKLLTAWLAALSLLPTPALAASGSEPANDFSIRYVISEPASLVGFVNIMAKRPSSTDWVREWFGKKRDSNQPKAEKEQEASLLKQFYELLENSKYEFRGPSASRSLTLNEEVITTAVNCKNVDELLNKIKAKVKPEDFAVLREVLEHFDPLYKQYIWNSCLDTIKNQLAEFESQTGKTDMVGRLSKVQHFLEAPWIPATPFTVVLEPLPPGEKHTRGGSLGALQLVELTPTDRFEKKGDVVFHEAVHALWDSKPNEDEAELIFSAPGYGSLSETMIKEGMATALGQGWYCEEAFGAPAKTWYSNKVINDYGHKVYPLYRRYVQSERTMDAAFGKEATLIYYENFPEVANQIAETDSFLLYVEHPERLPQIKPMVRKALTSLRDFGNDGLDKLDSHVIDTSHANHIAVLLSSSAVDELRALGLSDEQIKLMKASPASPAALRLRNKQYIFCVADTAEKQESILQEILSKRDWPTTSQ